MKPVLYRSLLAACCLAASAGAAAMPIVDVGKTVERADFSLTFDGVFDGLNLEDYEESGIFVTAPSTAYVGEAFFYGDARLTGFHYASGGNESHTSIRGVNGEVFGAIDFLLGNGWSGKLNYMRYSTYLDGLLTGTGLVAMDSGTVRISALSGFDELRVMATHYEPLPFGSLQAVALDDVHLQLWSPTAAVPEPGAIVLFGVGLVALRAARRRRP